MIERTMLFAVNLGILNVSHNVRTFVVMRQAKEGFFSLPKRIRPTKIQFPFQFPRIFLDISGRKFVLWLGNPRQSFPK